MIIACAYTDATFESLVDVVSRGVQPRLPVAGGAFTVDVCDEEVVGGPGRRVPSVASEKGVEPVTGADTDEVLVTVVQDTVQHAESVRGEPHRVACAGRVRQAQIAGHGVELV